MHKDSKLNENTNIHTDRECTFLYILGYKIMYKYIFLLVLEVYDVLYSW